MLSQLRALTFTLFAVGAYVVCGGAVLHAIESPGEDAELARVIGRLAELNISADLRTALEDDLGVCSFPDRGVVLHWDITGAIFFAMTVVTTIGYGTATPVTIGGRIFTTLYAVFGIGIIMAALGKVASLLMSLGEDIVEAGSKVNDSGQLTDSARENAELTFERFDEDGSGSIDASELAAFLQAVNEGKPVKEILVEHVFERADADGSGEISRDELMGALSIFYQVQASIPSEVSWLQLTAVTVALGTWMVVWSAGFAELEDWTFEQSLWWSFVTLSTIGFGDFAPHTQTGRCLSFVFIVLGLGVLAWLFSAISQNMAAKKFWMLQKAHKKGLIGDTALGETGASIAQRRKSRMSVGRDDSANAVECAEAVDAVRSLTALPEYEAEAAEAGTSASSIRLTAPVGRAVSGPSGAAMLLPPTPAPAPAPAPVRLAPVLSPVQPSALSPAQPSAVSPVQPKADVRSPLQPKADVRSPVQPAPTATSSRTASPAPGSARTDTARRSSFAVSRKHTADSLAAAVAVAESALAAGRGRVTRHPSVASPPRARERPRSVQLPPPSRKPASASRTMSGLGTAGGHRDVAAWSASQFMVSESSGRSSRARSQTTPHIRCNFPTGSPVRDAGPESVAARLAAVPEIAAATAAAAAASHMVRSPNGSEETDTRRRVISRRRPDGSEDTDTCAGV